MVTALGHEPLWELAPPEAWHQPTATSSLLHLVGQTGSLPWYAIESSDPARTVCSLAGRLARRGRSALVVALDVPGRRLGLAVAFDRTPHVELDLARQDQDVLVSLQKLARRPEGGTLAFAALAADALSTEPVGRQDFREFRATLGRLSTALPTRCMRTSARPGPASAHPSAVPLLLPDKGLARQARAVPGGRGRPLFVPPAPSPPRSSSTALLRDTEPTSWVEKPHRTRAG